MNGLVKFKYRKNTMDHSDIQYVVELLTDAIRDEEWENVIEAREFLNEYLGDDGSPLELEE